MAATVKARSRPSRCSVGPGKCPGRGTSRRRKTETTGSPRCPGWIRRLMLVIATSARTGGNHVGGGRQCPRQHGRAAIRRGTGNQVTVTVTDSHHPALRMAPAASSRRQCPRDSWTCCQRPWLSRGREWPEGSRIGPLCAGRPAVATLPRLGSRSRPDRAHGVGAVRVVAAGSPPAPAIADRPGAGPARDYVATLSCATPSGVRYVRFVRFSFLILIGRFATLYVWSI